MPQCNARGDLNVIKCKLCPQVVKPGIYRLKLHIAGKRGQVKLCSNATQEDKDKCLKAIEDSRKNKKARQEEKQEVRDVVASMFHQTKKMAQNLMRWEKQEVRISHCGDIKDTKEFESTSRKHALQRGCSW